jgi:TonB family protein
MNTTVSPLRLFHFCFPRLAGILLITLAWSIPGFSGEIHDAAKAGDLAKTKALLEENPELISSKDKFGDTPLHKAAGENRKDAVEFLLAKGADVNARNNSDDTPLHYAAIGAHKEVVELLLAQKADVNARNKDGITPLHGAAVFIYLGILDLPPDQIHSWVAETRYNHMEVVKLLLAKGADINAKADHGDTPLHGAVQSNYKDMVILLIANKADVNIANNRGMTPLDIAESNNRTEMAEFLRQHGGRNGTGKKIVQDSQTETGVKPGPGGGIGDKTNTGTGNGKKPYYPGPEMTLPEALVQPPPSYTKEAREARIGGVVKLQAVIRKDGTVEVLKILAGLGYGLDESAIDTISSRWRFKPGTYNGKPVDMVANIEVTFSMD